MKIIPLLFLSLNLLHSQAFVPCALDRASSLSKRVTLASTSNPADELSDERKANLFQFLLRDLEIEGVPLLGCDADQVHTFQAALWTTMGQLSENDGEEKACLILESIPLDALRLFVDDFLFLKTQQRLMEQLPELERISLSLVGKGVGPAILIETAARTDDEKAAYAAMRLASPEPNESTWRGAMESFVNRMFVNNQVCPDLSDNQEGPIAYRLVGSPDTCDTMSAFWSCMSEILALPEEEVGSLVMCLPPTADGADPSKSHGRFAALSELISRNLFLYRGEDLVQLWHMHPLYDRDLVFPEDQPQHGHLPPTGWLRPILSASGKTEEAKDLTDDQLKLQNYQRRSPLPGVLIMRVSQLESSRKPENVAVELDLGGGRQEMASDLGTYSANILKMIGEGEESLRAALDTEIASSS